MKSYYSKIPCDTPKLCRFSHSPMVTTLLQWEPEYDREGNLLNRNPNKTTQTIRCNYCGREFSLVSEFDETHVTEIKKLLNE